MQRCKYVLKQWKKYVILSYFLSAEVTKLFFLEKKNKFDFFFLSSQQNLIDAMKNSSVIHRVCRFYYDGFRQMTLGRTLWTIILIKLFVIFVVLKIFFFPDFLKQKAKGDNSSYVATELVNRSKE